MTACTINEDWNKTMFEFRNDVRDRLFFNIRNGGDWRAVVDAEMGAGFAKTLQLLYKRNFTCAGYLADIEAAIEVELSKREKALQASLDVEYKRWASEALLNGEFTHCERLQK